MKKRKRKNRYKAKYQTGGSMYKDNTVQSAGQGGKGTTANIVFDESNPAVLQSKLQQLEDVKNQAIDSSTEMAQTVQQQEVIDKQAVLQAEAESNQKFQTGEKLVGQGKEVYSQSKKLMDAKKAADALKATQTAAGALGSVPVGIAAPTAAPTATYGAGLIGPAAAPGATSAATTAAKGAVGGAGVGSGLAKFATSGAGIGTIGALVGTGVSMLSDDGDPTKSNVGEYSGSILSSAGTGASVGSLLGPVGTAVGAGVGAIYGAAKQFFGTKKAKKAQKRADQELRARVGKYNKQVSGNLASANMQARAGELEQKTYSGYDLGRNVVAQLGGMRMGMPRYA